MSTRLPSIVMPCAFASIGSSGSIGSAADACLAYCSALLTIRYPEYRKIPESRDRAAVRVMNPMPTSLGQRGRNDRL